MPEGDTVFLAARRLDSALRGQTLIRSDFRVPRYATVDLSGKTIRGVSPAGKHLFFDLGNVSLHTHFRMQGSWHLYRNGERWRRPAYQARVILKTPEWTAVGFDLPVIELVRSREEVLPDLGPDLLAEDFDLEETARRLRTDPERPLGEALLDQRVVAGLGNVYRSEVAFVAGLDPRTPVGRAGDVVAILRLAQRMIRANRSTGNQVTTGDLRHGRQRWVYGRAGEPCFRCSERISMARDGDGRVVYRCPACQPER